MRAAWRYWIDAERPVEESMARASSLPVRVRTQTGPRFHRLEAGATPSRDCGGVFQDDALVR